MIGTLRSLVALNLEDVWSAFLNVFVKISHREGHPRSLGRPFATLAEHYQYIADRISFPRTHKVVSAPGHDCASRSLLKTKEQLKTIAVSMEQFSFNMR